MRILIGCPVSREAVAGPATIARELERTYHEMGDEVRIETFSPFERSLPIGIRQAVFMLRTLPRMWWAESVLLLDTASTAPALALSAKLCGRHSCVRIGGDFLWEAYVERTNERILLSAFYGEPRAFTRRERAIRSATILTLRLASTIAFTTAWHRRIWEKAYHVNTAKTRIIENALPEREFTEEHTGGFLSAHRDSAVKNGAIMDAVWEEVLAQHPDAVLDRTQRAPDAYRAAVAACYAVIVPSLSEVSPNAVYEAIRFGKPFVCTRDTGVFDEFKHTGIFVDTRDAHAIAEAIEALLAPDVYKEATERVRSYARLRTWDEVATDFRRALLPY